MKWHRVMLSVKAPDKFTQHKIEDLLHHVLAAAQDQAAAAKATMNGSENCDVTRLFLHKPRVEETRQLYENTPPRPKSQRRSWGDHSRDKEE
jgi:hypothetical protein